MKIAKLGTRRVHPRWMFLKIETDEGIVGWGEPVIEGGSRPATDWRDPVWRQADGSVAEG